MSQWDTVKKDGKITVAEFLEYFTDVSASIDEDAYFKVSITKAWGLDE